MHLYIISRGIKHEIDRFISDLSAQYFPYKHKGKDLWVQLAMRPIQLWEIVMPEGQLQNVMRTLWEKDPEIPDKYKFGLNAIRKLLKLKSIPKLDEKVLRRIIYKDNIATYPIGIKEDVINPESGEML